jgi:hypothetical protein
VLNDDLSAQLLPEREALAQRVSNTSEQLERLRQIVAALDERLTHDEYLLAELDGLLGIAAQLRLESLDKRLRGQRLEEIAIAVLCEERGADTVVHYRDWFELLQARGHRVSGKNPLGTFLAQINRSPAVERMGRRTGRYRLVSA